MTTDPINMDFLTEVTRQLNLVLESSGRSGVESVRPAQSLKRDLGLDSLELAELTVRLEAEFGVDIFRDGMVESVADVIEKLHGAGQIGRLDSRDV